MDLISFYLQDGTETTNELAIGNIACTMEYDEIPLENMKWLEVPLQQLQIKAVLGRGQFGEVAKGEITEADGAVTVCAVKTLRGQNL